MKSEASLGRSVAILGDRVLRGIEVFGDFLLLAFERCAARCEFREHSVELAILAFEK